jgi:8-oxo-dGTP pyrophosphatase MutT (NUDIX family)
MRSADALLRQIAAAKRIALRPSNAVAALLLREDGGYIMQLRDAKEEIFFPGHWGCFGGAVDPGEEPAEALRRELREELALDIEGASRFTRIDLDFSPLGRGAMYRVYYEIVVPDAAFRRVVLGEGAEVRAFPVAELLNERVVPYDGFAVWMHAFKLSSER